MLISWVIAVGWALRLALPPLSSFPTSPSSSSVPSTSSFPSIDNIRFIQVPLHPSSSQYCENNNDNNNNNNSNTINNHNDNCISTFTSRPLSELEFLEPSTMNDHATIYFSPYPSSLDSTDPPPLLQCYNIVENTSLFAFNFDTGTSCESLLNNYDKMNNNNTTTTNNNF